MIYATFLIVGGIILLVVTAGCLLFRLWRLLKKEEKEAQAIAAQGCIQPMSIATDEEPSGCPWCGQTPVIRISTSFSLIDAYAFCRTCAIFAAKCEFPLFSHDEAAVRRAVIKKWNTRAGPSTQ